MGCLTAAELKVLGSTAPDSPESAAARDHLSSCAECRRAYRDLLDEGGSSFDPDATMAVDIPWPPLPGGLDDTIARARAAGPGVPAPGSLDETRDPESGRVVIQAGGPDRAARHFPRIEGYVIQGVLGHGGMGVVYRAVQARLNRTVALKVLPAMVGAANPAAVDRFRREATAAGRLHHTNIIPIYDFGESGDAYFYAMELIRGEPLDVLVRRLGEQSAGRVPSRWGKTDGGSRASRSPARSGSDAQPADGPAAAAASVAEGGVKPAETGKEYFRQVGRWMADAADALHYAHSQGVIHRDVKPANLILSHDGRIMIADFGLAKSSEEESVTLTGAMLGTMRYISPEQAMARRVPVDHRTDIYSLGATFYEMLCLQPLFPETDEKRLLAAIMTREPVRPRKINASIPPELEIICLKSIEKTPEARYASARDLADDLRRYSSDLPIVARRPSILQRSVKFLRRHKAVSAATAAVVLLIMASVLAVHERNSRRVAESERRVAEVQALYDSGMFYATNAKWDEATQEFERALLADPGNLRVMLAMVWMYIDQYKKRPELATSENLERVLAICNRVLAAAPDDLTALNYASILYKNLNRYDEAIAATRRAVKLNPDHTAAWVNLGAYCSITGRLTEAEECLRRGAELLGDGGGSRSVDQSNTWRNLAALEAFLNRPEAEVHLQKAIDFKVDDVPTWVLRVRYRLARGEDLETALDDAKHADRLANGRNALAKRYLGLAYLRNGHWERASGAAEAAMSLGDWSVPNQLVVAVAKGAMAEHARSRAALEAAERDLAEASPFKATYDRGVLWFESKAEWTELLDEARLRSPNASSDGG